MITQQSTLVGDGRQKTVRSATELKQIFQQGWNVPPAWKTTFAMSPSSPKASVTWPVRKRSPLVSRGTIEYLGCRNRSGDLCVSVFPNGPLLHRP